ncbi:hypothetical protein [Nostoc sp.]|uniref:hypothetical protein n=1 Tax=Nostoc sp. TaxID=1180 RepID=UPI002FFD344A
MLLNIERLLPLERSCGFDIHIDRCIITLVIGATAITGGIVVYGISQFGLVGKTEKSQPIETTFKNQKVAAFGRLEPEAEVIPSCNR